MTRRSCVSAAFARVCFVSELAEAGMMWPEYRQLCWVRPEGSGHTLLIFSQALTDREREQRIFSTRRFHVGDLAHRTCMYSHAVHSKLKFSFLNPDDLHPSHPDPLPYLTLPPSSLRFRDDARCGRQGQGLVPVCTELRLEVSSDAAGLREIYTY